MNKLIKQIFASVAISAALASSAYATVIGPGTLIADSGLDSIDKVGRLNINLTSAAILGAGSYAASTFSYDAGRAGTVTPFLAILTGIDTFKIIAVGSLQTIAAAAQDVSVNFGNLSQFQLAAATTVYAGIATYNGANPIFFNTSGQTDHDANGLSALTLNGTVNNFSNANLARQYVFAVDVTKVPEPASFALLGLGLFGLVAARRKSRTNTNA